MCELNHDFANRVGEVCMATYLGLDKKGKPENGREWTKMACIIKMCGEGKLEVVSLATGTKCIGEKSRNKSGTLLNDSHAEILARRLFHKYIFRQLEFAVELSPQTIFEQDNETKLFKLKENITFHLFTTDTPCGDASIYPKKLSNLNPRKRGGDEINLSSKRMKSDSLTTNENESDDLKNAEAKDLHEKTIFIDTHRTGAKCVPQSIKQDSREPGSLFHETGALRIKPGRGDRTLSMSCSDKIMKWCVLGLTSGLLQNFLVEPIYLSSIIIGNTEFDHASVTRALSLRGRNSDKLKLHLPIILNSGVEFVDAVFSADESTQKRCRITPSGTAILYCKDSTIHEISVLGRMHGITKKDINSPKARTSICKRNLFQDFKRLLDVTGIKSRFPDSTTYFDCKRSCKPYEKNRDAFFQIFSEWTSKSQEEEEFCLGDW